VQATRARERGAILRYPDLKPATLADVGQRNVVLLIHGLTADARYMGELMRQFDGAGYAALAYEYPCYDGIDEAAKTLAGLLTFLDRDQAISGARIVVVGHSMGGLVARALIALEHGARFIRTVITLGAPHDGTLASSRLPRFMAHWGEAMSGMNPRGFSLKSASALQLLCADGPDPLLARLMRAPVKGASVAFYSFSGGYNRIDFGKGILRNLLFNHYLQMHLSQPNDGLVPESSSDLSQQKFGVCAPGGQHIKNYPDYSALNHTYLVKNHYLALAAIHCAQ
jgi:pimeloyl-ACP methyl ester carboxylesterase